MDGIKKLWDEVRSKPWIWGLAVVVLLLAF
jgi:hypothetical protein